MRRRIVVNGVTWSYRVGKAFVVAKNQDTGKGERITLPDLIHIQTGEPPAEILAAMFYGYWVAIKPSLVSKWLMSFSTTRKGSPA